MSSSRVNFDSDLKAKALTCFQEIETAMNCVVAEFRIFEILNISVYLLDLLFFPYSIRIEHSIPIGYGN